MQLKLLIRVVKRRVSNGEKLEEILKDYPKMKPEEADEVSAAIRKEKNHV
nr:MAG TPA: Protein of unknown function (DUF433) [Caudoviricetes sp.]